VLKALLIVIVILSSFLGARNFRVSYDPDYAPFSFSRNGQAYGLFIDIWKLWAKTNQHTIDFVKAKDWDNAIELAHTGKADFFLGTDPYAAWMKASIPYYETQAALFGRKDSGTQISSIGIIGDDYRTDLAKRFPQAKIFSYSNYKTLLDALLAKKVNVIYDDSVAIAYFAIENNYIHQIKKLTTFIQYANVHAISTDTAKITLFDEGFKKIPAEALLEVEKNWIFSKDERYYRSHFVSQVLTYVYDPDWKPFEYTDAMTHRYMGIIADILGLIEAKTGVKLRALPTKSWNKSMALIKDGKAEMVSAIPYSKEKASYLTFTAHDIYAYPAVLLSTRKKTYIQTNTFKDQAIGIIRGNSLGKWVMQHYPKATFVMFKGMDDALAALEEGHIDFFAVNGVTALYYINALGHKEIHINVTLDYIFHLKIAFRKSVPQGVVAIMDEALGDISQKEKNDIYHKWTSIKVQKETNWKLLGGIVLLAFAIFLIFYLINLRLKKLVSQKTQELREFNEQLEETVLERTEELQNAHDNIQKNIQYASLIQHAILPKEEEFQNFFKAHFVLWEPKDIVGGDIYFFHQKNTHEAFLFLVDCTGHGVSGAFVTMLVKALEEQLLSEHTNIPLSPSAALASMNRLMKKILRQKKMDSDVGLDAAVVHIDKADHILTFAGANIPLFYGKSKDGIAMVKPDRYSVGYTHCKDTYQYKEHKITLEDGIRFYLTSDGFIDQNGGEKGFPLGKKRFMQMIGRYNKLPLAQQKSRFQEELLRYQGKEVRNDDIVFIGFEV